MTEILIESIDRGVATLTLNRPDSMNALSRELYDALLEALPRLAGDASVGAVVLTGAGRAFCAGSDVKSMIATAEMTLEARAQDLRRRTEIVRWLHEMPVPTIAMVNGAASGAGLSLALACDLRIAGEAARFATAFARVGLPGDFGVTWFLTQIVGPAKARELLLLADPLDAAAALALGMVNRVVADGDLTAATVALAQRLADGPRVAHRYMKANFNAALRGITLSETLELEAFATARARATEDHQEATRAFVEKRKPVFKGR
ncbi:MAG: enoyl-CoA hydratase [Rhodospirillales bacterium]|jgi:2-(1,2-epoxy-1,2-dihydrophenyl)acetyl-CoA isomerase|nr:enoyl-CoA hydratase [Rhodospirillales bacterium]